MTKKIFFTAPNLSNFTHAFFSKEGGISKGIYSSLNCGMSSFDQATNIKHNRKIIANTLGFNIKNLVIGDQYHSNKVITIKKYEKNLKCDGIISLSNQVTLGVLTADCCPLLIGHINKLLVATIHIGWKGLLDGIIDNFFLEIENINIKFRDLIFAIGPCIGKESYEVDSVFFNLFGKKDKSSLKYFSKIDSFKYHFDIRGYIKHRLKKFGINNIWCSNLDTYRDNSKFFSYRYASHKHFKDYGRMLSVIKK